MYSISEIGFYTLTDERTKNIHFSQSLSRCEMIVTSTCNFKCPYCRGVKSYSRNCMGHIEKDVAMNALEIWCNNKMKNVRFSGGEPTFHPNLNEFVLYCKNHNVEHIAISTNGSRDFDTYNQLVENGVNDFSISLDACCANIADKMAGVNSKFETIIDNIKKLSKISYVTVGIVFTEDTIRELENTIQFAHSLGVADIRIISAAQYNKIPKINVSNEILSDHPILKYRIGNLVNGNNVRGISNSDCHKCHLVVDDIAMAGKWHFPCVIYMREGGEPIGEISTTMIEDRKEWYKNHNSYNDEICRKNCLDCLVEFNNQAEIHS